MSSQRNDHSTRRASVLIVDDTPNNRNLLAVMLANERLELRSAASGEEALAMIAQSPPNLVLLDVVMPGVSGHDVARAIKNNPETRTIPVIMVTAHDDTDAKRACLAAGVEDFLTKPVDRFELCMRVQNLLRLHSAIADADRARAQAEVANRSKAEFLTVMSHELRTPLNAIGGYTELMQMGIRGPVTPEQLEDLGRIQESQRHLMGIINGILSYARIEAGTVQFSLQPQGVSGLLATCEQLMVPEARARDVSLSHVPCEDSLQALADHDKFRQIVLNLLSNAVSFTAPGGHVELSGLLATCEQLMVPEARARDVSLRHVPCEDSLQALADHDKFRQIVLNLLSNAVSFTAPGGHVELSASATDGGATVRVQVTDTGIGIPADQLDRVFEPFVQVDMTLTRTRSSTGLGLAISRELARAMNGDLTVQSTVGVGSTFVLTLPRVS